MIVGVDDVIVVGGGTAGCVVAARLSADPGRSVRLIEAGAAGVRHDLRSATSLAGSVPGHPATWSFPGHLTPDRPFTVPRGRILGGSSAVNGAYFTRGTPADYDDWAARGSPAWAYDRLLPYFRAMETDHDFAGRAHGDAGPMPVTRPSGDLLGPAPAAFLAACRALGHPDQPDRNGGGPPGAGPVPANTRDGERVSTAAAYLPADPAARPNLTVTTGTTVRRVVIERGRAVGVEAEAGGVRTVLRAGAVILCAGAVNTAHLLLLSGIGPAADLRRHGLPVVRDAPVGASFTDHPQLWLTYRTAAPVPVRPGMILTQTALDTPDAEYLSTGVPMAAALAPEPPARVADGVELALVIGLPRPESRGRLRLASADPDAPPRLDYGYLEPAADRTRLRAAVRHGREILATPPLRDHAGTVLAPGADATDRDLDAWIRANLQTAFHLSGTAPMGAADDPHAVTDQYGRVHGVAALRVADTSVIPVPMRRGPAATAVLIGERMASFAT
jgi:predicted dehydrogenase (TIGR03970 family)